MKTFNVNAISSDLTVNPLLIKIFDLRENNSVYSVIDCSYDNMNIQTKDHHLYSAFRKLRIELVKNDLYLLCKGCLINVHPSGRQLISTKANILIIGKRTGREDTLEIFDPIENIGELFSLQIQSEYYSFWAESIKGVPYN